MEKCLRCGVVLTPLDAYPEQEINYYESDYSLTATTRASTEMHRYFRYPEYIKIIGEVLRHANGSGTWLDVGCDHGFFLDDVRRFGFRAIGVEPSKQAREYGANIGLDIRATVDDVSETVNVVSLWHVLEHISEPLTTLRMLHTRLSPGGLLCVRVPDAGSLWSKLLRDKWIWFQPHHHAVHYTLTTLQKVVEEAGFSVSVIRQQKPNTYLTSLSYDLATNVFSEAGIVNPPSLRSLLARQYQNITGCELFLIAKKP